MCRAYCGRKKQKSHCIICKCIHATIKKSKFSETNLWLCANWCHGQFCCHKFRGDQLLLIWQCCWLWSSRQMYQYWNKCFWRPIILVWHWWLAFLGLQITCIKNAPGLQTPKIILQGAIHQPLNLSVSSKYYEVLAINKNISWCKSLNKSLLSGHIYAQDLHSWRNY